jgi:hypothetical protein
LDGGLIAIDSNDLTDEVLVSDFDLERGELEDGSKGVRDY